MYKLHERDNCPRFRNAESSRRLIRQILEPLSDQLRLGTAQATVGYEPTKNYAIQVEFRIFVRYEEYRQC